MHEVNLQGKSVFPIVSPEKTINYKWYDGSENIDSKVLPMSLEQINCQKEQNGLTLPPVVNEGTVLMRHPYLPNSLVSANMTMGEFLDEKLSYYAVILNYLGATAQTLEARVVSRQSRKFDGKGKLSIKGNKLEGKVSAVRRLFSKVKSTKRIEGTGKLDYNKALELAKQYGLENDIFVKTVLELRHENPVPSFRFETEIAKEYNDTLDVAASMVAGAGVFKLNGSFKKSVSTREEIWILQDISFK